MFSLGIETKRITVPTFNYSLWENVLNAASYPQSDGSDKIYNRLQLEF